MDQLLEIKGIGPVLAKKLLPNIPSNVKNIRKYLKDNFYNELSDMIKADLDFNPKAIPRQIINKLNNKLKANYKRRFIIAGSYRRGKKTSGDIDILISLGSTITQKKINNAFNDLSKLINFVRIFARGPSKFSCVAKLDKFYCFVDIFFTTNSEWYFALLYATGSGSFNQRMRSVAKRKGYRLNQKGIFDKKNKSLLAAKSEKDIFDFLNINYLDPSERN